MIRPDGRGGAATLFGSNKSTIGDGTVAGRDGDPRLENLISMSSGGAPCGACKFLRRKCVNGCIFALYFDSEQGATHFVAVHKVVNLKVKLSIVHAQLTSRLASIATSMAPHESLSTCTTYASPYDHHRTQFDAPLSMSWYSLSKGMGVGSHIVSRTFSVRGEGTHIHTLFELTLVDQSGRGRHKGHSHFDYSLESEPYILKFKGSMWYLLFLEGFSRRIIFKEMMMEDLKSMTRLLLATIAIASLLAGFLIKRFARAKGKYPPAKPGLPIIGNLLQLKDMNPYNHFTNWGKEYGPIYSIRMGAKPVVVINSSKLAKEAMVAKFQSTNTKNLTYSLRVVSGQKTMIALNDYVEYHLMSKKLIIKNLLSNTALKQKQSRIFRENMLQKIMESIHSHVKANLAGSSEGLDVRKTFVSELFPYSVKQIIGRDMESIYVEELGGTLSKWQLYDILVEDLMKAAIEEVNCYLDILITEAKHLTSRQVEMSLWEPIAEASDTTGVPVEWALFELAKNQKCQDRLYKELQEVCGDKTVTEDDLPKLKYLNAVFHETLRKHPPVRTLPMRNAHEDVQIGGFDVPAGWQIAINVYGCNHNEEEWQNAREFMPERFLEENKTELVDLYRTMTFGAGKRVCTGALQAMLLGSTTIARFVQEFQWDLPLGDEDLADTVSLTTHKLHPFKAIVTPRRSSATNH
eukprot:Gb_09123 [translate_table: standard]